QARQLCLSRGEPLLKLTHVPRTLAELAPQEGELFLQERDLRGEIVGLFLPPRCARIRVVAACHVPPPRGLILRRIRLVGTDVWVLLPLAGLGYLVTLPTPRQCNNLATVVSDCDRTSRPGGPRPVHRRRIVCPIRP